MAERNFQTLMRRLSRAGFKGEFVQAAVLPDWWSDECARDPSLLPEVELRVARFLDQSVETVRLVNAPLKLPSYPNARLRNLKSVEKERAEPAIHAALRVAEAVSRNLRSPTSRTETPVSASEWRKHLLERASFPDLKSMVPDLWARGIPVLHVEVVPSPKFQGMACIVGGRPMVLVAHDRDDPAWFAFTVAHEVGHIANGDCQEGAPVIDETEESDGSQMERKADAFGFTVLNGRSSPFAIRGDDWRSLASHASRLEQKHKVDAAHLIQCWARAQGNEAYVTAKRAVAALWKRASGAKQILREQLDAYVDVEAASETDRALLSCLCLDPDRDGPR